MMRKTTFFDSLTFSALLGTALFAGTAALLIRRADRCRVPPALPSESPDDLRGALPSGEAFADWAPAGSPATFTPADLFQLIDGGADLVIEYGFRRLLHAEYQKRSDPGIRLSIDLYDMGTPEGAFGIYGYERGERPSNETLGDEGIVLSSSLTFRKGRYYVKFETSDLTGTTIRSLRPAALQTASRLPGPAGRLEALDCFPPEGLVHGSARLLLHGALGIDTLGKTYLADYDLQGRKAVLFFCPLESEEAARRKLELLAGEMKDRWAVETGAASLSARHKESGERMYLRTRGPFVTGLRGDLDEAGAAAILERWKPVSGR